MVALITDPVPLKRVRGFVFWIQEHHISISLFRFYQAPSRKRFKEGGKR